MKYETGPWRACPCGCGTIWSQPYDYVVATINTQENVDSETVRYNQRIIESAPEMLKLIRLLAEDGFTPFNREAQALVDRIDNPPEENRIPDHRSPFEKMTQ